MEATVAIGVTGNVLQFIQFISTLISTASGVYLSKNGLSESTVELENIYQRLSNFSASLQTQKTTQVSYFSGLRGVPTLSQTKENSTHIDALNDLAKDCKALCDQLLKALGKLKVKDGKWRRFKSFMVALRTVWDMKKIADMEARLDRYQSIIAIHFFPILSDQQSGLMRMVTILRNESYDLNLNQNSKLNAISSALSELKAKAEEIAESSVGNSTIKRAEKVENLSEDISRLSLKERELGVIAKEQAVLRSLNFPSRPVRHDNIPLAHEKTFQWMINPLEESDGEGEHQFIDWLKNGDGIFWVSGKPGSGKSTLMKFLAGHETTRVILDEWANPLELVIAAHYFWSAGTPMQKSHEGLLKTLLYEIFRIYPSLIPEVCPVRWAQTNPLRTEKDTQWTISELLGTLQAISGHSNLPGRYCFFIDGIDEFEGDHSKLCEILKELSQSPNIKLCLASRPWNVFVDAFGNDPMQMICIEDLTRNDILQYTESRLTEHPRWNLCHFQLKDKRSIIDDITGKAQGVFLWVYLVTKSLRDGLTNGDTMLDLRKRLESLPTDLEEFFKHMLEVVNPLYHEKMAGFLSIASNANQPLRFLIYSMHEHDYEDEDYAVKMPISPLSEGEYDALHDQCRRRVNARCGGLLNVKGSSVEFLHRTVRDFIFTAEMSDYLAAKTKPGFLANLSILRAYLATMKSDPQLRTASFTDITMKTLLEESLQYANDALEDAEESAMELLDNLEDLSLARLDCDDTILEWKLATDSDIEHLHKDTNFLDTSPGFQFREGLLRAGIYKYVSKKLHESRYYFDNLDDPPLNVVINERNWTFKHMQIIHDFLIAGEDPNMRHNAQTSSSPWTCFILRTCRDECKDNFHNAIKAGLFSLFLRSGASRDTHISDHLETETDNKKTDGTPRDPPPSMPSSYFVKTIFSQYSKNPGESLRVLEEFFDLSLNSPLHPAILDILQKELSKIEPRVTRFGKLKFYAEITEKVISVGKSLDWEMGFLIPDIQRVFPQALASGLMDLVNMGEGSQDPGLASRKRSLEHETIDRTNKRARLYLDL